ncbi:MAG TPA: sulfatase, partial [Armatimonadetes bacterium]|nr:sulfatase [Armatimonadota bacterium]
DDPALFAGLASVDSPEPYSAALIRPAKHNRNLQVLAWDVDASGQAAAAGYYEVDGDLRIGRAEEDRSEEVEQIASVKQEFTVDAASVTMMLGDARYRLPKAAAAYDQPFAMGWPRCVRECVSERYLVNAHGTFYEMPRDEGLPLIKPVCTHNRRIFDFCTWRGLMVLSGVRAGAEPDGHIFRSSDGRVALWFGHIDDLWQLGKPVGKGGPWLQTPVSPGEPSDPYLMTGYDRKRLDLSHGAETEVVFQIEVDADHHAWHAYQEVRVPAGQVVTHHFPEGYSAHWIRFRVDRPCRATAILTYS